MERDDLEKRFTYHAPQPGQSQMYEVIRENAKELAICITALTPEGREQSLAITALEECVMWTNAAIARSGHIASPTEVSLKRQVDLQLENWGQHD